MGFNSVFKGLRRDHRLRVFEKWVLRRIFGPKRDGVTEEWKRLRSEELHDLYLLTYLLTYLLHGAGSFLRS